MERAYTINDILNKKYKLFDFGGEWEEAFSKPERCGVWFIWGNSGNGKTRFTMQLAKYLTNFGKVLYNSLEEGSSHTIRKAFEEVGMSEVKRKMLLVSEPLEKLAQRLEKQRSSSIIIIDSFQYAQISYKQYIAFKEKHNDKLIIFVSHADGKQPAGRSAKSVMYDATLKIWVEGFKAFSKGRYIGDKGQLTIWSEGAAKYWQENDNDNNN